MQTDIAMMNMHLQHEKTADSQRDNVSQSVEQRITAIEQLIQTEQLKQRPADPAAAQPIDPLQQCDSWANFLSATKPPGLGESGTAAPPAQTPPAVSFGASNTTSTMVGFIETRWNIDRKVSKELEAFDDRWENYEGWYSRIREHAAQGNQLYLRIFDLIEATPRPIRNDELADLKVEGLQVDWKWISVKLWTFIGDHVTDLIHSRRVQLTLGEEFNGLELWRALYVKHKGGTEQMTLAGMGSFLNFPKCSSLEGIQSHVGEWQLNRMKFGSGIPDGHLRLMFLGTLPEQVVADIKRRIDLVSTQQCVNYVIEQLGTYNDKRLASHQASKLQKSLGTSRTVTSPLLEQPAMQPTAMPTTDAITAAGLSAQLANMESLVAAITRTKPTKTPTRARTPERSKSGLAKPDPKF